MTRPPYASVAAEGIDDGQAKAHSTDPTVAPTLMKGGKGTKKERAILALLQYPTHDKAAEAVGIHPATLWRWRKEPAFQQALGEARQEAFAQSVGRLQQSSSAAVTVLQRIMTDQNAPAGSRVRAAEAVLQQSRSSLELDDLERRLARLEKASLNADPTKKN